MAIVFVLFTLGLFLGIIGGWKLCRGLALSQPVTTDAGEAALRVTLDPGSFPWSGAEIKFIDPAE